MAAKRYDAAAEAYQKLIRLDPGIAELYSNLGLAYFEQRRFGQAVPAFQHALKLKPDLSNAGYFLAMSLSELGQYGQALPDLEKGFSGTHNSELKRLLGLHLERTYTGLGHDGKAVEVALTLMQLYPNDPEVLYQTGRLCGNFAFLAMQKLQEVAPQSIWRHLASGELFESDGHYDLALREYRRALELSPNRHGIHYRMGRVLLRSKKPGSQAEALKEFEQELKLDPTNASAAYEAGEIYRKSGQLGKARALFEEALKYYPDFEDAQVGLGRTLVAEKNPDLAVTHLHKALSLNPQDDVAWFQLAKAYQALGKTAGERKALAEFQRLETAKAQHQTKLAVGAYSLRDVTKQDLDSAQH